MIRRRTRHRAGEPGATALDGRGLRAVGMTRILLASDGRPIPPEAVARAVELARSGGGPARVVVLSVARIWGSALGLPHPGLYPTRREWDQQRGIADAAACEVRSHGIEVRTRVVAARNAPKAIARWAEHLIVDAIVVAEPELPRWRRVIEGGLASEIARRTRIPVHAVRDPGTGTAGRGRGRPGPAALRDVR